MSPLQVALDEYLAVRRALGYKLRLSGRLLQRFIDFADGQGATYITSELAAAWATLPGSAQPAQWANRLGMVRHFALYCSAQEPRTVVPPPDLLPHRYRRPDPYLYSDEQIKRLLDAAQRLPSATGLRPHTFATLFGLYVATGLRANEPLHLNRDDVDLTNGLLTIRGTKFGKSRYVPVHPSAQRALQRYADHRARCCPDPATSSFFVSDRGTRLTEWCVRWTFVKLSREIGLRGADASRGPRLHDTSSPGDRYAAEVVSARRRRRTPPARAVGLPRPRPCHRHVLVLDRDARAPALRHATGAALQGATAMSIAATLPALVQSFFMDRLMQQRQASPHTIASYRDTFRLLFQYAQQRLGKSPTSLTVPDLDTPLLGAFLEHLERDRKNSARSRNVRLAAIHSFFRYVALHAPEHSAVAQRVLAMPSKRYSRCPIAFLSAVEVDALLAAPDLATWSGRRDRTLLMLAVQTGLRAAELTGLHCEDIVLGAGAHVRCEGKGRKRRCTPLRKDTVRVLRDWLRERGGQPSDPLFPTTRGTALSHDALQDLLNKHLAVSRRRCPSLARKRVTPHVLRHTLAMDLLHHGAGQTVIALWLGHESPETTAIYLHADMQPKERALAATTAKKTSVPRFRPSDQLLDFLKRL